MAASASDLLQEVGIATATTLDSNYTISDTTVTVASTSGWPTATGVTFAIDVVDANGVQVAGSYNEYVGTVATATSVSNVSHVNGTDRNYSAGATTRVYIPVSAERENRIVEWGTTEHNQDGTHSDITADSVTINSGGSVDFSEAPLADTDIASNAVTTAKIADEAVTSEKLTSTVAFSAYGSSSTIQTVTNSTVTAQYNTELFDIGSDYDTSTYKFVAPYDGIYHFVHAAQFDALGSGTGVQLGAASIGVEAANRHSMTTVATDSSTASDPTALCTATVQLTAGDEVTALVAVSVSNALIGGSSTTSYFTGFMVGRT